jgi:hypothetical protein
VSDKYDRPLFEVSESHASRNLQTYLTESKLRFVLQVCEEASGEIRDAHFA